VTGCATAGEKREAASASAASAPEVEQPVAISTKRLSIQVSRRFSPS
jgi:hypothetical protein